MVHEVVLNLPIGLHPSRNFFVLNDMPMMKDRLILGWSSSPQKSMSRRTEAIILNLALPPTYFCQSQVRCLCCRSLQNRGREKKGKRGFRPMSQYETILPFVAYNSPFQNQLGR